MPAGLYDRPLQPARNRVDRPAEFALVPYYYYSPAPRNLPVQEAEKALNSSVEAERKMVGELRVQAAAVQQALEAERALAEKLRSEMKSSAESSSRLVRGGGQRAGREGGRSGWRTWLGLRAAACLRRG